MLSLQTVPRQIFALDASNRLGPTLGKRNSSPNGECPACLTEIRADLGFLWYQLCWVQRSQIVIFSFVRALWQFDFLVVNLLVGNETQDV